MLRGHYLPGLIAGFSGGLTATAVNLVLILLLTSATSGLSILPGSLFWLSPETLGENLLSFFAF